MKSSSKSEIYKKILSDYREGDVNVRFNIFSFLCKYVFQHEKRYIDPSDVGLHSLIPDILNTLYRSDFNAPLTETITFVKVHPSCSSLSPYLKEESPFVVKDEKGNRWWNPTRKIPMLIVGWFGKQRLETTSSKLAIIYFVKADQHRRGDIVSIERGGYLLYNYHLPVNYIRQTIKDIRNVVEKKRKKSDQKWKEIRKNYQKNGMFKECENCGREFIAYRTDARSCSFSACKKALSRKNKIRDYERVHRKI